MRVRVLSDLHLEFMGHRALPYIQSLPNEGVDVLVLAGDTSTTHPDRVLVEPHAQALADRFEQVIFVNGNHEHYNSRRDFVDGTLEKLDRDLENFHFLNNSTVTIKGQRFVGTTLWFPEGEDNWRRESWLNDFRLIRDFREWVYEANREAVQFLQDTVQEGDFVVTHHIPTIEGVHPKWRDSEIGCFFLCQLPRPLLEKPKFWAFGHTHDSMDFTLGSCRFVCNPSGYWRRAENPAFRSDLTLEV
jgi:3',5'-cyclic AMP phosphodiesterase CpdA